MEVTDITFPYRIEIQLGADGVIQSIHTTSIRHVSAGGEVLKHEPQRPELTDAESARQILGW